MPPSKAATTARPSTGANPNKSALHSVRIGLPLPPRQTVLATRFSQIQGPDAPTPFEKSGLVAAGATVEASAEAVAARCHRTICMVETTDQAESVILGEKGIIQSAKQGD